MFIRPVVLACPSMQPGYFSAFSDGCDSGSGLSPAAAFQTGFVQLERTPLDSVYLPQALLKPVEQHFALAKKFLHSQHHYEIGKCYSNIREFLLGLHKAGTLSPELRREGQVLVVLHKQTTKDNLNNQYSGHDLFPQSSVIPSKISGVTVNGWRFHVALAHRRSVFDFDYTDSPGTDVVEWLPRMFGKQAKEVDVFCLPVTHVIENILFEYWNILSSPRYERLSMMDFIKRMISLHPCPPRILGLSRMQDVFAFSYGTITDVGYQPLCSEEGTFLGAVDYHSGSRLNVSNMCELLTKAAHGIEHEACARDITFSLHLKPHQSLTKNDLNYFVSVELRFHMSFCGEVRFKIYHDNLMTEEIIFPAIYPASRRADMNK